MEEKAKCDKLEKLIEKVSARIALVERRGEEYSGQLADLQDRLTHLEWAAEQD